MRRTKLYTTLVAISMATLAGPLLVSCSLSDSADEPVLIIDPVANPIVGYWLYTGTTFDSTTGLYFSPSGEVWMWENYLGEYREQQWGYCWLDDNGELQMKDGGLSPMSDAPDYKITSLTSDRLVIRTYGGLAGTPFEKGRDMIYKKLPRKPVQ